MEENRRWSVCRLRKRGKGCEWCVEVGSSFDGGGEDAVGEVVKGGRYLVGGIAGGWWGNGRRDGSEMRMRGRGLETGKGWWWKRRSMRKGEVRREEACERKSSRRGKRSRRLRRNEAGAMIKPRRRMHMAIDNESVSVKTDGNPGDFMYSTASA